MTGRRTAVLAGSVTAALLMVGAPAFGKGGEVGGSGDDYFLTDGWNGTTDTSFSYGRDGDRVYVGSWTGAGSDTLAVRRGATYYFSNSLSDGNADRVVTYGRSGDTVLMGDWDGDGVDTPVVRRGARYLFKNDLSDGHADREVTYGRAGDVVLVGDWDGDGKDTLGVRRGNSYFLKNSITSGNADREVDYGRAGDDVIVGSWNGRGGDTLGVRRGNTYYVKDTIAGGNADRVMSYGSADDAALVGDWDGDGADTIGLRRPPEPATPPPAQGGLTAYDAAMVDIINAERRAAGVPPVRAWPALRQGALDHSRWMGRTGDFEHASSNTIREDGRRAGCDASAENIFWGTSGYSRDPAMAMESYMNSPGHRANILDPQSRFVAVGTTQIGDGSIYNTQRFARSCS